MCWSDYRIENGEKKGNIEVRIDTESIDETAEPYPDIICISFKLQSKEEPYNLHCWEKQTSKQKTKQKNLALLVF